MQVASLVLSTAIAMAPPVEPAATATSEPTPLLDPCRRGRRNICRDLKIGGGFTLGVGLAGLGAGIGLATLDNRPLPDLPAYQRAYRPAGIMIIPLAVVLVVAGTLLIVKAVRTERRRRGRAR